MAAARTSDSTTTGRPKAAVRSMPRQSNVAALVTDAGRADQLAHADAERSSCGRAAVTRGERGGELDALGEHSRAATVGAGRHADRLDHRLARHIDQARRGLRAADIDPDR